MRQAARLLDRLATHHAREGSIRLVIWKAAHPARHVSREEVLDALIAHGWIDGRSLKLDADRTVQLVSRRRQQAWAATRAARTS